MAEHFWSDEDWQALLAEMVELMQRIQDGSWSKSFGFEAEWRATASEVTRLELEGVSQSDPQFRDAVLRHRDACRAELDYQNGVATMHCPHCRHLRHTAPITLHELAVAQIAWGSRPQDPIEICFGEDEAAWARESALYHSGVLAPNDRFIADADTVRRWRFLPGCMVYASSAASGSLRVPLGRVASVSPSAQGYTVRLRDREPPARVARIIVLTTDPAETAVAEALGVDNTQWQVGDDVHTPPTSLMECSRPSPPVEPPLASVTQQPESATTDQMQRAAGWIALTSHTTYSPLWGLRVDYTATGGGLEIAWGKGPFAGVVATFLAGAHDPDMPVSYTPEQDRSETRAVLVVGGVSVRLHSYNPHPAFHGQYLRAPQSWRWPQPLRTHGAARDTVLWIQQDDPLGDARAVVIRVPWLSQPRAAASGEEYALIDIEHKVPNYSAVHTEIGWYTALSTADIRLRRADPGWSIRDADEWLDDKLLTPTRSTWATSMTAVLFPDRAVMRLHAPGLRIEATISHPGDPDLVPAVVLSALHRTPAALPRHLRISRTGHHDEQLITLAVSDAMPQPEAVPRIL